MEELWEAADDSEQLQRLAFQIQERDLKLQIQEHELAILRAQQALGHKQPPSSSLASPGPDSAGAGRHARSLQDEEKETKVKQLLATLPRKTPALHTHTTPVVSAQTMSHDIGECTRCQDPSCAADVPGMAANDPDGVAVAGSSCTQTTAAEAAVAPTSTGEGNSSHLSPAEGDDDTACLEVLERKIRQA